MNNARKAPLSLNAPLNARKAPLATTAKKLDNIYYSPSGYYKGLSAIKTLATKAEVTQEEAREWLSK